MARCRSIALAVLLALAATPVLHARVTIEFDYRYDDGFFTAHPERRAVLEFAAEYVTRFTDDLSAITVPAPYFWDAAFFRPDKDDTHEIRNLEVRANTLLVFVGAYDLDTAELGHAGPGWIGTGFYGSVPWMNNVESRGEAGALEGWQPTDFGPWGGSVAFDNETDTSWYFGLDTDRLGPDQYDFLSVAIHELGHVLGLGIADSWDTCWDYDDLFYGDAAVDEHGEPVPIHWDYAHWADGTMSHVDGVPQMASMTPYINAGERQLFTDLDFAGLADIGWDVEPRESTWRGAFPGWHYTINWNTRLVPGVSHTAVFDQGTICHPLVDDDVGISRLDLRRAGWTFSGSGRLTVYFGGIQSAGAGTNTLSVPLTMGSGFACTVAEGNTLALTGGLDADGCALTKDGPGTLALAAAENLARLDVQAGTVRLTGAAPLVTRHLAVDTAAGALLDLMENNLIVDYDPSPNTHDEVLAAVKSAWASGGWDGSGITCDGDAGTFALGVADNADTEFPTRNYLEDETIPVDESSILVRYTLYGNANLDDRVDAADLNKVLINYGEILADPGDIMPWFLGNFNYDDRVDAADLNRV
ncbi:MAG: hypothetical protein R6X20_08300, partial [Phycisphaerae bacterium]